MYFFYRGYAHKHKISNIFEGIYKSFQSPLIDPFYA